MVYNNNARCAWTSIVNDVAQFFVDVTASCSSCVILINRPPCAAVEYN